MGCPCKDTEPARSPLEDRLAEVERRELQNALLILALSVALYWVSRQVGKD